MYPNGFGFEELQWICPKLIKSLVCTEIHMILTYFRSCWGISFAIHFSVQKLSQEALHCKGCPFSSASARELRTYSNNHKLVLCVPISPTLSINNQLSITIFHSPSGSWCNSGDQPHKCTEICCLLFELCSMDSGFFPWHSCTPGGISAASMGDTGGSAGFSSPH